MNSRSVILEKEACFLKRHSTEFQCVISSSKRIPPWHTHPVFIKGVWRVPGTCFWGYFRVLMFSWILGNCHNIGLCQIGELCGYSVTGSFWLWIKTSPTFLALHEQQMKSDQLAFTINPLQIVKMLTHHIQRTHQCLEKPFIKTPMTQGTCPGWPLTFPGN